MVLIDPAQDVYKILLQSIPHSLLVFIWSIIPEFLHIFNGGQVFSETILHNPIEIEGNNITASSLNSSESIGETEGITLHLISQSATRS